MIGVMGQALGCAPCHTAWHVGPHRAVRADQANLSFLLAHPKVALLILIFDQAKHTLAILLAAHINIAVIDALDEPVALFHQCLGQPPFLMGRITNLDFGNVWRFQTGSHARLG